MLTPAVGRARAGGTEHERAPTLERATILSCFVIAAVLAFTRNVNWDEFHYLSFVYDWVNGRLDRPMQMGHVHLFGWLTALPGDEVFQITVARLVMTGFLAVTCSSIYLLAAHFATARIALFAVCAYLLSGFVLTHGASFRADPIATALLMLGLAIAFTSSLRAFHIIGLALLVAVSLMITIKSALYLPAFLGAMISRYPERGSLLRLSVAAVFSIGLFAALYSLHTAVLTVAEGKDTASTASSAVQNTLLKNGWFPRWDTVSSWALLSLPQLVFCVLAFKFTGLSRRTVTLFLFLVPVLSVAIYKNAYVYYFPFATPLLMVIAAIGAYRMGSQRNLDRALVFMIAAAGLQLVVTASENNSTQRQTIAEVHRLFPEPISYIDGYGMVSSFDNKSFFTSSWGTKGYRTRGVPVFPDIIAHDRPPLLIAHRRPLGAAMFEETLSNSELDLLPEDREALRGSYVHYSGAIWLAGKSIVLGENETVIALPFPGRYRLEAETEVRLNGSTVQPGNSISVTQTSLVIAGQSGTKLRLIWDAGVEPIARSALRRDIFAGFTRLVFFD